MSIIFKLSLCRLIGPQFPTFLRFFSAPAAAKTFTNDGLDALPFDIKDGCPEKGYLTLTRKYQDEIIEVKVRPYYETNNSNYERYGHKYDSIVEEATYGNVVELEEAKICNEEKAYCAEVKEALKYLRDGEKGANILWKKIDQDVEFLYMLIKIYYGDDYNKCQQFYAIAFPDYINIRSMSTRVEGGGDLEEYQEWFKYRVTDPNNFFSTCLEHLKTIGHPPSHLT